MAIITNARDIYLQSGARSQSLSLTLTTEVTNFNIAIRAVNTTGINLVQYTYRKGDGLLNGYGTSIELATTGSPEYTWDAQVSGTYVLWVVAKDLNNNETTPVSTTVSIVSPGSTSIASQLLGPNLKLDWGIGAGDMAIDYYEIRSSTAVGATWSTANLVGTTKATTYTTRVNYTGTTTWWVAARSISGEYSTAVPKPVTISAPSQVTNVRIDIVDNNALITWTEPTISSSQLPIEYYDVTKGDTYATSTSVGSNGNSTFTSIFEQASGTYNYWIVAYDTAGTPSSPVNRAATINQPPDYILRANYNSNFSSGTYTNFYLEQGSLVGPANTTQTWSSHFVAGAGAGSWATPAAQVAAGYPIYIAPNVATGTYEEILDYGTSVVVSTTGTVGSITGTGPWTSTITGMTSTTGLVVGSIITATAGTGTLHNGAAVYAVVASIINSTSITCTTTGGTTPTAGTITNVTVSNTLPPTVVTSTLSTVQVSGGVLISCVMSHKMVSTEAWTVLSASTSNLLPKFRYVRIAYTFTAANTPAGSTDLVKLTGLNVKLSVKLRNDSGSAVYDKTKTDAQNFVSFGYPFVSADNPVVQATTLTANIGTAVALTPLVIYDGGINPTGFSVRLYDKNGVTQSGAYSWTVRGY